ncbi:MAG TPA: glycosyltransferase family 39 protein [Phycisphaerae bacterium]|nr:glycosyltransferase family 39 protein [Phycisphaerae bacterium]
MTDQPSLSRPRNSHGRDTTSPAVALLATALICLPILGIAQVISHIRVDEFDAWLFAYYGKQLTHGRVLYEQLWDNKPPGIFWLNAVGLWLSGGSLAGPIALCAAAVAAACAVFLVVTRRLYGLGAAAVATVMAAVFLNHQYFHVGCNRPNTFLVLTELTAFLLYVRAVTQSRTSWRAMLAAGFCAGLGLWFKQTGLALAAAVVAHQILLTATGNQSAGTALRRIGHFAAGWATACVVAIVILAITSSLRWAWDAIVAFNRNYFAPGVGAKWWPDWFGIREGVDVLALPGILALATLAHAIARRFVGRSDGGNTQPPVGSRPPLLLPMLWVWMAVAAYVALIGPHQRLPYFGVALPPLCMLAAHGVYLFLSSGRTVEGRYPPFYLFIGVIWFGYMLINPLENQLHALNRHQYYRFEDTEPNPDIATAESIHRHTGPDDAMFVWGYAPGAYWLADRPSAIRYIGTEKATQLQGAGQPLMDEIIGLLRESRPKVFVITVNELARIEHPHEKDPLDYHDLASWVRSNYTPAENAPKQNVWVRDD